MGEINFNGIDTAVHGPVRLGILTALHTDGSLDFTTLKKRLEVADGALGLHLKRLEEEGYLSVQKTFIGRRPNSRYRLAPKGRKALMNYVETMRQLIDMIEGTNG